VAKNPYEWLYEREKQPLKEYVLDEVAKRLARAVEQFPPTIESWEREDFRLRFEPLLTSGRGRPTLAVVRVSLKLFRWELEREYERIDEYLAGGHDGLEPDDRELAIFLWRYWLEEVLEFKEFVQDKFLWRELLPLVDRLQARLVDATPSPTVH